MRAQGETTAEVMSALGLMALRAEMEALAAVLPGLWQGHRDLGSASDEGAAEAGIEAEFDNMPV